MVPVVPLPTIAITVVAFAPVVGVKLVMVGAGIKVNVPELTAVPPGVVRLIVPVVPLPTTAVTVFASTTVTELAEVPPMLTAEVPKRFVPVMVTVVPLAPVVGVK